MLHPQSTRLFSASMDFPVDLRPPMRELAARLRLDPLEVEESFVRGSGAGGQKINKTSSAVQLRHRPTGIEVRSQDYRERPVNRLIAWKRLIRKLEEKALGRESAAAKKAFKLRKQKATRSRKAKRKMLADKRHRGEIKEARKPLT